MHARRRTILARLRQYYEAHQNQEETKNKVEAIMHMRQTRKDRNSHKSARYTHQDKQGCLKQERPKLKNRDGMRKMMTGTQMKEMTRQELNGH